jgi:hypothetical protein
MDKWGCLTWSIFSRDDVFEPVHDDRDDGEGERQDPSEQRVDDELLPLSSGAQSQLCGRKLKQKIGEIIYLFEKLNTTFLI